MQLNVTGLAKHYGDTAVFSNVSLQVNSGEFVAIVGESGVGKSTLLNCLAGLDHWDQGTVQTAQAVLLQEFSPISDMRASADYRRQVLGNLLQRFWLETQGQALVTLEALA